MERGREGGRSAGRGSQMQAHNEQTFLRTEEREAKARFAMGSPGISAPPQATYPNFELGLESGSRLISSHSLFLCIPFINLEFL